MLRLQFYFCISTEESGERPQFSFRRGVSPLDEQILDRLRLRDILWEISVDW